MESMTASETTVKLDREKLVRLWKKWFRRDNLLLLVLAGILLFVIAIPVREPEGGEKGLSKDSEETGGSLNAHGPGDGQGAAGNTTQTPGWSDYDYETLQEEKLRALLSVMDGVGAVEVMLTFSASGEQVVQKDEQVTRANTIEKDSEGGSRTVTQYEKGDTTIYSSDSGTAEPFVIKTLYPRVEGVLVVAEGAGDGTVNRSITEAAQALFGVEAHRVKVVPMGNKHISETGLIQ